MAANLKATLLDALDGLASYNTERLLERRHQRLMGYGKFVG